MSKLNLSGLINEAEYEAKLLKQIKNTNLSISTTPELCKYCLPCGRCDKTNKVCEVSEQRCCGNTV